MLIELLVPDEEREDFLCFLNQVKYPFKDHTEKTLPEKSYKNAKYLLSFALENERSPRVKYLFGSKINNMKCYQLNFVDLLEVKKIEKYMGDISSVK